MFRECVKFDSLNDSLLQIHFQIRATQVNAHRSPNVVHLTEDRFKVLVVELTSRRINAGSMKHRLDDVVLNVLIDAHSGDHIQRFDKRAKLKTLHVSVLVLVAHVKNELKLLLE